MKKFFLLFLLGTFGLSVFLFFSQRKADKKVANEAVLGVVETSPNVYLSQVLWFDKDLNPLSSTQYSYAMLGSPFYSPIYQNGKIYLIPEGLGNQKDSKKVISFSQKDWHIEEYPFQNIGLNHIAVIDEFVYAVSTVNGLNSIERWDTVGKQSKVIEEKDLYCPAIFSCGDYLLAYSMALEQSRFYLDIYDKDLNRVKREDVSEIGFCANSCCEDDNFFYLPINNSIDEQEIGKILKINKRSFFLEVIDLPYAMPKDIYLYQEGFLISHFNPVTLEGTKLCLYDKKGKLIQEHDLGMELQLTAMAKDHFYVANEEKISAFTLPNFSLIHEREINRTNVNVSYISSIILR